MCTHCGHKLAVIDLIPVVSWLSLGGKCRYCHKKIEDSPLVELATAGLFVISYLFWPYAFTDEGWFLFVIWLAILIVLITLFIYDLRYMLLPDKLTLTLFVLTLAQLIGLLIFSGGDKSIIVDALLGVLALGGFFYVLFQVSKGRWIGGGDVKLGAGLGVLAGDLPNALMVLFFASAIGTVVSAVLLITNKASKKSQVPFGPFLVSAAIVVRLFGQTFIDWYQTHFLLV